MAYVKSAAIGLIAAVACIALFTGVLGNFRYDARYLMGKFWFISLLVLLVVFATDHICRFAKHLVPSRASEWLEHTTVRSSVRFSLHLPICVPRRHFC